MGPRWHLVRSRLATAVLVKAVAVSSNTVSLSSPIHRRRVHPEDSSIANGRPICRGDARCGNDRADDGSVGWGDDGIFHQVVFQQTASAVGLDYEHRCGDNSDCRGRLDPLPAIWRPTSNSRQHPGNGGHCDWPRVFRKRADGPQSAESHVFSATLFRCRRKCDRLHALHKSLLRSSSRPGERRNRSHRAESSHGFIVCVIACHRSNIAPALLSLPIRVESDVGAIEEKNENAST